MNPRHLNMLNFFSIGLLLFALYLNFVKKEVVDVPEPGNVENTALSNHETRQEPTSSLKQPGQTFVLK